MLTHELKTPLSVVSMGITQPTLSENSRHHMIQAVSDMSMVIDRCSMLEKIDDQVVMKKLSVNLFSLLQNIIKNSRTPERIEFHYPEAAAVNIRTDEDWLRVILLNLFDNALKYSPKDSPISIWLEKRGRKWCINVKNQTTEILPDKSMIFKKYYRSKSAHKQTGSGIGLYIVKRLATQLRADIEYIPIHHPNSDNKEVIFRLCLNTTH